MWDKKSLFADDQAFTATAYGSGYLDLGVAQTKKLHGNIYFEAQITESFAGPSTGSIKLDLYQADDSNFSGETVIRAGKTYTVSGDLSDLAAGERMEWGVLPMTHQRYVRAKVTIVGPMTAGKLKAGLRLTPQTAGFGLPGA